MHLLRKNDLLLRLVVFTVNNINILRSDEEIIVDDFKEQFVKYDDEINRIYTSYTIRS